MLATLQITEKCNLNCTYCFEGEKGTKSIPLEMGLKAIDYILANYLVEGGRDAQNELQESLTISFYGGEAFLEFSLLKKLHAYANARAKELGCTRVNYLLFSNGYLMTEEQLDFLREFRSQLRLKMSLDGQRASHNANRRTLDGRETFAEVLHNAQRVRECCSEILQIAMVVTPGQARDLYANVTYLIQEGFQKVEFDVDTLNSTWDLESMEALAEETGRLVRFYMEQLQHNPELRITSLDDNVKPLRASAFGSSRCGAGRHSFFINVDGEIYCCAFGNKVADCHFGDLETGFHSGVDLLKHWDDCNRPEECRGCANETRCMFNCIGKNVLSSGSIYGITPAFCAYNKIKIAAGLQLGNSLYEQLPELFLKRFPLN